MNNRERRDFEAGLSAEVDSWLNGDTSRRTFLTRFGQLTGMIAASGPLLAAMSSAALAQAKAQFADPSTPLGKAQLAALKASTEGPADGSAYRAVQAAKNFPNLTITQTYEAGLQALEPRNYSGPLWEQLTGTKWNVVELPIPTNIRSRSPSTSPIPAPMTSSTSSPPGSHRWLMAASSRRSTTMSRNT